MEEYKIKFKKFWSDWTDVNEFKIDLEDYQYFELVRRFGNGFYLYGCVNNEIRCLNEDFEQHCLAEPFKILKDLQFRKISVFEGDVKELFREVQE